MTDLVTVSVAGLPSAGPITGNELVPVYQNGRLVRVRQGDVFGGGAAYLERVARVAITAGTVVVGFGGQMEPADPLNADHCGRVLGILTAATARGATGRVQSLGPLDKIAVPVPIGGDALFVGLGGALARSVPVGARWRQVVARSESTTSIVIALGEASLVGSDLDAMIDEDGFSTPASVTEIVTGQGDRKYVRAPELGLALPQILLQQPAILLWVFDNLPPLPADPANYPLEGGLFRNGDANGYSLVRLYPQSGVSALAAASALGLTDDLRQILTTVLLGVLDAAAALPAAGVSLPAEGGLFRSGDDNGYSLTRIYPER